MINIEIDDIMFIPIMIEKEHCGVLSLIRNAKKTVRDIQRRLLS